MKPALEAIRNATLGTPYEGIVWLVGGAVRDELLGFDHGSDLDLVVGSAEALPEPLGAPDLAGFLWKAGVSEHFPVVYERFGTAMVHVAGVQVELVTSRSESYRSDSRKPSVRPAPLIEDARRRDFTVNSLMQNLHSGELSDPLGIGLADLRAKVLRTPLPPNATFHEDPLRMLRAVRFRFQLGFRYADGLEDAIRESAERLRVISAERIRDEFLKMLVRPTASEALEDLRNLGLLAVFAPELEAMKGVEQGNFHHLDVWDHTRLVVKNAGPGDQTLALAALLHDIAKPVARTVDSEGRTRFFGHEAVGATMARAFLLRLKLPGKDIDPVVKLVRHHMRLGTADSFSKAAARRLVRDLGDELPQLLDLVDADAHALKPGLRALDLSLVRERIAEVEDQTPRHQLESPLSGLEIAELLGLQPGPEIGRIKQILLEKVLEGELAPDDKTAAKAIIRGL